MAKPDHYSFFEFLEKKEGRDIPQKIKHGKLVRDTRRLVTKLPEELHKYSFLSLIPSEKIEKFLKAPSILEVKVKERNNRYTYVIHPDTPFDTWCSKNDINKEDIVSKRKIVLPVEVKEYLTTILSLREKASNHNPHPDLAKALESFV